MSDIGVARHSMAGRMRRCDRTRPLRLAQLRTLQITSPCLVRNAFVDVDGRGEGARFRPVGRRPRLSRMKASIGGTIRSPADRHSLTDDQLPPSTMRLTADAASIIGIEDVDGVTTQVFAVAMSQPAYESATPAGMIRSLA